MPVYEIGPKTSSHHHLIFSRLDVWFFPAPGYKLLQLQFIPMIVQKTKKPWRTNKYQILLHNLRFMSCTTSLHEGEIGVKRNLLFLYMDIRCNFLFKMVSYDESFAWWVFIKKQGISKDSFTMALVSMYLKLIQGSNYILMIW